MLKKYSLEGAIGLAGALQLVSENLEYAVRLEMLALVAATAKNRSEKSFPAGLSTKPIHDSWFSEFAQYEQVVETDRRGLSERVGERLLKFAWGYSDLGVAHALLIACATVRLPTRSLRTRTRCVAWSGRSAA
jgi:hypothetical protein